MQGDDHLFLARAMIEGVLLLSKCCQSYCTFLEFGTGTIFLIMHFIYALRKCIMEHVC